jgi:undecaprenyl-diphosphatase
MRRWKIAYVAAALSSVAAIAVYVQKGRSADFDLRITTAIQRQQHPAFQRLMAVASWAGFPPQSRFVPLLWAGAWLLAGRRREAAFQLAGWGTSGLSFLVKSVMQRPRPHIDYCIVIPARIGGTSFPSGHAINYTGVYGTMAYLIGRSGLPKPIRRLAIGACLSHIALVGPSRIYLGHHWFTDVVTSYLLGSSYVIALTSLYDRVRDRVSRR